MARSLASGDRERGHRPGEAGRRHQVQAIASAATGRAKRVAAIESIQSRT
jgi:hypothetical protein